MTTALRADSPSEKALREFMEKLALLLQAGYTGNVTVRVQQGIIRNYRTEQVEIVRADQ